MRAGSGVVDCACARSTHSLFASISVSIIASQERAPELARASSDRDRAGFDSLAENLLLFWSSVCFWRSRGASGGCQEQSRKAVALRSPCRATGGGPPSILSDLTEISRGHPLKLSTVDSRPLCILDRLRVSEGGERASRSDPRLWVELEPGLSAAEAQTCFQSIAAASPPSHASHTHCRHRESPALVNLGAMLEIM